MRTNDVSRACLGLLMLAATAAGCDSSESGGGGGQGGSGSGTTTGQGGSGQGGDVTSAGGEGGGLPETCDCGAVGEPMQGSCEDGDNSCFVVECVEGEDWFCVTEHPSGPPDCPEGEIEVPEDSCTAEEGCHVESLGGFGRFCAPVGHCSEAPACETPGAGCVDPELDCGGDFVCSEDHLWVPEEVDCG